MGMQQGPVPPVPAADATGGNWESDTTATAVISRPRGERFTKPTVPFPPRRCPKCTLDALFVTRSAFREHLKKQHRSYWDAKQDRCFSYDELRSQRKGKKVRLVLGHWSRNFRAQDHQDCYGVRPTTPSAISEPCPVPVPLIYMVGGLRLPRPRQPQLVSISNITNVNPFPGPRPLLLDPRVDVERVVEPPWPICWPPFRNMVRLLTPIHP